jgi:hypothetical protein
MSEYPISSDIIRIMFGSGLLVSLTEFEQADIATAPIVNEKKVFGMFFIVRTV